MSIFGGYKKAEELAPAYEGFVDDSYAGLQEILAESTANAYELNAGLYISDIMMEQAVLEGAAQPEVLLEGLMKDVFGKVKNGFIKLYQKIKAWILKVISNVKLFFMSADKFIKKYEAVIKKKDGKDFTYKGWKFDFSKGEALAESLTGKVNKFLSDNVNFEISEAAFTASSQAASAISHSGDESVANSKETKEKLLETLGYDSVGKATKAIIEAFHAGETSTDEYNFSTGNSKDELIGFVESGKTSVAQLNKAQKATDDQFKRVLAAIKRAQSQINGGKLEDDKKGKAIAFANLKLDLVRYAMTLFHNLVGAQVTVSRQAASQSLSVLKSFVRAKEEKPEKGEKPTTASAAGETTSSAAEDGDVTGATESTSILEAALRNL